MTKEEYLSKYKEEKLAEICVELEAERNYYKERANDVQGKYNRIFNLEGVFKETDQLYKRIKTMPAEEFLKLYKLMNELIYADKSKFATNDFTHGIKVCTDKWTDSF